MFKKCLNELNIEWEFWTRRLDALNASLLSPLIKSKLWHLELCDSSDFLVKKTFSTTQVAGALSHFYCYGSQIQLACEHFHLGFLSILNCNLLPNLKTRAIVRQLCINRNSYLVLECLLKVLEFLLVDFVSTILTICFHVCDVYDLFVAALAHQWKNTGWFGSHL